MDHRSAALLRTDLLMGVDFVPRAFAAAASPPPISKAPIPRPAASASLQTTPRASTGALVAAGSKAAALEALRLEHATSCPHCTKATFHQNLVFGEGDAEAKLVFVGEAPGENEDRLGRPFVGRAGQKLDEMILAMGLQREQVYIANVLKSRPPDNRTPLPHEVAECGPTLARQLAVIRPLVIVTLGAPATKYLLQSEAGITRLRGVWGAWQIPTDLGGGEIPVMPTFHPAYLLRNYTPETRKAVWSDLQQVMIRLGLPSGPAA